MLCFLDEINKIFYIMAPKCGNTTIAHMLNVGLQKECDFSNINNPEYKKIIIIRKNVVDRFLSGFYEDLLSNTCYDNLNITFNDYLLFLHKCFQEKIPYVDNMNVYNEQYVIPIWWGNCSNQTIPLTNSKGEFCSHIQNQKYAIGYIVSLIKNKKNVEIVEIQNLSKYTNNLKLNNIDTKLNISDINYCLDMTLAHIKQNKIKINENLLTDEQKELIIDMYKEDIMFINNLEKIMYEPDPEPVIEPDPEPVSKPVSEPVPEPVPEPVVEPNPEPLVEPVSEPLVEPVSEPVLNF
jgi:hypothetical protein